MIKATGLKAWQSSAASVALFLVALAVGFYLRLHMLGSQILLDDEWHGVIKVTGRTLFEVATNLDPTDNATVPFNLYYWSLYRWFHWSEWTLRLPSIVAGLASLILLPWMIRRILGHRVAAVFALFLAIAPVLVFHSRYARAYGLSALLCFGVLLLSHEWLTTARTRYAVGTVLLGTSAVYVHPTSLVAVFAPLVIGLGLRLAGRPKPAASASGEIVVSTRALLSVGILDGVLSLPVVRSMFPGGSMVPWAKGTATADGLLTALSMISGTANLPLNLLFFGLCVAGHVLLWKEKPLLGRILLGTTGLYVAFLLASHPEGIGFGAVVIRYMIVVVPSALLGVALAIERMTTSLAARLRIDGSVGCYAGAVILAGGFFLAGPLPELQRAPNNFTSHSAFQGSYLPPRWDRSEARAIYPAAPRREDRIPPFYRWLRDQDDVTAIVEYPFDVCNFNSLYYYYQHFHGKRVLAGYSSDPHRVGAAVLLREKTIPNSLHRMLSADVILSRVPADGRIALRNMADVTNQRALLASGAGFVVLHKILPVLVMDDKLAWETNLVHFTSTDDFSEEFRRRLGSPVYEDAELVCFRLTPGAERP